MKKAEVLRVIFALVFTGKIKIHRTRQWLMWLGDCSLLLEGWGGGGGEVPDDRGKSCI